MLMRNAKVEVDGTYVPPKHAKLSYSSMIFVRQVSSAFSEGRAKAVTQCLKSV